MKTLLVIVIALVVASFAFAVVDPDPDSMGLYFDENADIYCVDGVGVNETVIMHLILTRPTHDFISGFEAGYDLVGNAQVLSTIFCDPNIWPGGSFNNMIIGFVEPCPTSEATILATQVVMILEPENGIVEFFLHGSTPSSLDPAFPTLLLAGGVLQMTGVSVADGPTAQINGDCTVVATENLSFDRIKSLYW